MQSPLTPEGRQALRNASAAGGAYQDRRLRAQAQAQNAMLAQQQMQQQADMEEARRRDLKEQQDRIYQRQLERDKVLEQQWADAHNLELQRHHLKVKNAERDQDWQSYRRKQELEFLIKQQAATAATNQLGNLPSDLQHDIYKHQRLLDRSLGLQLGARNTLDVMTNLGTPGALEHFTGKLIPSLATTPANVGDPRDTLRNVTAADPNYIINDVLDMPALGMAVNDLGEISQAVSLSVAGELSGQGFFGHSGSLAAVASIMNSAPAERTGSGDILSRKLDKIMPAPFTQGLELNLTDRAEIQALLGPTSRGAGSALMVGKYLNDPLELAETFVADKGENWLADEDVSQWLAYEIFDSPEKLANYYFHSVASGGDLQGHIGAEVEKGLYAGQGASRIGKGVFNRFNSAMVASGRGLTSGEREHLMSVTNTIFQNSILGIWDNGSSPEAITAFSENVRQVIANSPDQDLTSSYLGHLREELKALGEVFLNEESGYSSLMIGKRDQETGAKTGEQTQFMGLTDASMRAQLEKQEIDPASVEGMRALNKQRNRMTNNLRQMDGYIGAIYMAAAEAIKPHVVTPDDIADMNIGMFDAVFMLSNGSNSEFEQITRHPDVQVRETMGRQALAGALNTSLESMRDFIIRREDMSSTEVEKFEQQLGNASNILEALRVLPPGQAGPSSPGTAPVLPPAEPPKTLASIVSAVLAGDTEEYEGQQVLPLLDTSTSPAPPTLRGEDIVALADHVVAARNTGEPLSEGVRNALKNPFVNAFVETAALHLSRLDTQRLVEEGEVLRERISAELKEQELNRQAKADDLDAAIRQMYQDELDKIDDELNETGIPFKP